MQPHKRNPRNKATIEELQNNDRSGSFEHDFVDDEMSSENPQEISGNETTDTEIENSNSGRQENSKRPSSGSKQKIHDAAKPRMGGARENEGGRHSRTSEATGTRKGNR